MTKTKKTNRKSIKPRKPRKGSKEQRKLAAIQTAPEFTAVRARCLGEIQVDCFWDSVAAREPGLRAFRGERVAGICVSTNISSSPILYFNDPDQIRTLARRLEEVAEWLDAGIKEDSK